MSNLPFSNNSTSRAAAYVMPHSEAQRQRQLVYDYIRTHNGATDDELSDALQLGLNSIHPRRWQLVKDGIVEAHPTARRTTKSGRAAIVWVLTKNVSAESADNPA